MEREQELKNLIVKAGQNAVTANWKNDTAGYWKYLNLQNELKEELEKEQLKKTNFIDLIGGWEK